MLLRGAAFPFFYGQTGRLGPDSIQRMLIERKLDRDTRLTELVEANNIARSINRIKRVSGDRDKWKMAIYHAMFLSGCWKSELERVRQAFELP